MRTDLYAGLVQLGDPGEFFPHVDVGIVRLGEGLFQFLQLLLCEGRAMPATEMCVCGSEVCVQHYSSSWSCSWVNVVRCLQKKCACVCVWVRYACNPEPCFNSCNHKCACV